MRAAAAGETPIDAAVTRRLVDRWAELEDGHLGSAPPLDITDREREVLTLLAQGLSNRDLAERLYLSEATVKTHVSSLLAKLGVHSRVQAVILAYERGVVRVGQRSDDVG